MHDNPRKEFWPVAKKVISVASPIELTVLISMANKRLEQHIEQWAVKANGAPKRAAKAVRRS